MTYARKMAEKSLDAVFALPDQADMTEPMTTAVEAVINEVIERCAQEALRPPGGAEAAYHIRRLSTEPQT